MAKAGGIAPLVSMLSSACQESQTHAAAALRHLSKSVENNATITKLDAIPKFVELLTRGSEEAARHAAGALWQLATTADNKVS